MGKGIEAMKTFVLIVPILLLLAGCGGELAKEQAAAPAESGRNASAESVTAGILEGVDPNSPAWAFLSYRIASDNLDAKEFSKYAPAKGVLVRETGGNGSGVFKELQVTGKGLKEITAFAASRFIGAALGSLNVTGETVSGEYAYLNLSDKHNPAYRGMAILVRDDAWRVMNETWTLDFGQQLPPHPENELFCFKTVLGLVKLRGEPQLCKMDSEKGLEFTVSNDGERRITALNVSLQGSRGNATYMLQSSIEPGFVTPEKVSYDADLVGELRTIRIIPHTVAGEKKFSCYFENSSITVDAATAAMCT